MSTEALPRAVALDTIRSARERLNALIDQLTDADVEKRAALGGGDWSVKDLIGHLGAWEERALRWLESPDAVDATAYPPTDEWNAAEVERKSTWSLAQMRAYAVDTHQRLCAAIERLDDDAWEANVPVSGHDPVPRGFVVGMVLAGDDHGPFAHDLAHLGDVEGYVATR